MILRFAVEADTDGSYENDEQRVFGLLVAATDAYVTHLTGPNNTPAQREREIACTLEAVAENLGIEGAEMTGL